MESTTDHIKGKINVVKEKKIKLLNLSGENLLQIPDEVFELENLEVLNLSYNQLEDIPDQITNLHKLTSLHLIGNKFVTIPEPISKLRQLTILALYENQIATIPDSIAELQNLLWLDLDNNQLETIPENIFELKNLMKLYVSYNELSTVPDSISKLKKLTSLKLSGNYFTSIPDEICKLRSLKHLNFNKNRIRNISPNIVNLRNLKTLNLINNPIEDIPPEVLYRDVDSIKSYIRQMSALGKNYLYEAKMLIIGEAGAGKTTLSRKLLNPNYKLRNEVTTKGIDVIRWDFQLPNELIDSQTIANPQKKFRVNIWDFGGQEIYHATHQFFLTRRSLYALVADTRKENTDFYYWLNIVELLSDKSPLLIIKNEKQDRHQEINERQLRGQFTNLKETLATNFATNRGMNEIMKVIKYHITSLPHVGAQLPRTWFSVREILENDARNYISFEEYLEICSQKGIRHIEDKIQFIGYLHDIGVCLHFRSDPILRRIVILKPEWGTAAVYKVLDNNRIIRNLGMFSFDDLVEIWRGEQYANMQNELLRLMVNFKLCYKIKYSDNYIAPQLLTASAPEYKWEGKDNLLLRYTYEFMPKGIITRFIVEMHKMIALQKYVWRSGVILEKEERIKKGKEEEIKKAWAEVIEYYDKREIRIRMTGQLKKELMTIIVYELDKIHSTYKRLRFTKWIPCNCHVCANDGQPHFYKFDSLKKRIFDKKYLVECEVSYEKVNVLSLIDDILEKSHILAEDEGKGFVYILPEPSTQKGIEPEKKVFVSYSWGGKSEDIVNQLDRVFKEKGIKIVRDKRDLDFKGSIRNFMEKLGRGKCVIVIISKKYLQSESCMFELINIANSGQFPDRVFPIVLEDVKILKSTERIKYVQYWENEIQELEKAMKTVSAAHLQGFREDIDLYTEIRKNLPYLTNILKDMNTLTVNIHTETDFAELIKAVEMKMAK